METSVNLLVGLFLLGICITSSFAFPPKHDTQHASFERRQITGSQNSKNAHHEQQNAATEEQDRVNTVSVMCHPDSMEIVVKADMFEVGAPIDGDELRLGVEHVDFCRATATSHDEYRIVVGLLDCGTKHWMTEDSLIYTNLLIYSPMASPDGVIRMDEAVIPIECHYGRKYSLSSASLTPTWIPFTSTQAAVETLDFGLSIMTSDWLYERSSNVFYLGQPINIEASVRVGHHMGLRVFVSSCVATLSPDRDTVPRYIFIENNGCLVDSQLQGSNSKFLPRTQDDKLQLVIDAFRFHQEDRGELYITCHLNAVPLKDAESQDKACTFINGRWRSADGNDYLCGYCQSQNEVGQTHSMPGSYGTLGPRGFGKPRVPESLWRSGLKADKVWEQVASVGPMLVLPARQKSGPLPVEELPPLLSKISRPALYGSQWRSGINFKTDLEKGLLPGLLPTPEQRLEDLTTKMPLTNGSQQNKGDHSDMDLGKSGTDLKGKN
ncbi:zona pellucida sperm-binding protein 3-like [Centroberyx affinis]|uniref:zona pellucida sperm-binding protein 3-like n=1 Tax=Centroberyx affinis TaxID=166261 RepID=UPI003A5BFA4D